MYSKLFFNQKAFLKQKPKKQKRPNQKFSLKEY